MANIHSKTIQDLVHNNPGHYSYQDLAVRFNIPYEQVRGIARLYKIQHLFNRGKIGGGNVPLTQENTMSKTKKELTTEARLEGQLRAVKESKNQEGKKFGFQY